MHALCSALAAVAVFFFFYYSNSNDSMHNANMEQDANNSLMSIMLITCMTKLLS